MTPALLLALAANFALLSLLAFGGIGAVTPEIHRVAVEQLHWLSEREFVDYFAIAQGAPGPNVLFVTLIGWHVAGIAGALVATPRHVTAGRGADLRRQPAVDGLSRSPLAPSHPARHRSAHRRPGRLHRLDHGRIGRPHDGQRRADAGQRADCAAQPRKPALAARRRRAAGGRRLALSAATAAPRADNRRFVAAGW